MPALREAEVNVELDALVAVECSSSEITCAPWCDPWQRYSISCGICTGSQSMENVNRMAKALCKISTHMFTPCLIKVVNMYL